MAAPPTRIDEDLYREAEELARHMSRSTAQQLAHWARIGKEFESDPSVSQREIAEVLAGRASYDDLNTREQAVVRTEWSEQINARRESLNYAESFAAEGRAYSELDRNGRVVRRRARRVRT